MLKQKRNFIGMIWDTNRRERKAVFIRHEPLFFLSLLHSMPDSKFQETDSDWLSSGHMLTSQLY